MDVKVQAQSEQWEPLASVVIEAYKLSDKSIMELATTDRQGVATFHRLPEIEFDHPVTYGFRARVTRRSGASGNLNMGGVIRLNVLTAAPKRIVTP